MKQFTAADYAAAERFLPSRLLGVVKNAAVAPNWIDHSERFWYRRDGASGEEFVLVDAQSGAREIAFDRSVVASAIETVTGTKPDENRLGVTSLDFDPDFKRVEVHVPGAVISYDRTTDSCAARVERTVQPFEGLSPDRRLSAFCRDDNLWVLDRATGEERQLTTDGERYYGYGGLSDAGLVAIPVKEGRLVLPPIGVVWSPDSRYIVAARVDERHVREYPYTRFVPLRGARPTPYTLRRALMGDPEQPLIRLFVVDVNSGGARPVTMPFENAGLEAGSDMIGPGTCWFDSQSRTFFSAQTRDDSKTIRLVAVDLASTKASVILEERVAEFVNLNLAIYSTPNVRILGDGKEIVWFSERDGWGHLYLYGGDGGLKRQLTQGPWVVFDIMHVDEEHRQIYFTGSSRLPSHNPYLRFLYRAPLDGGEPVLLTPELTDHMIDGQPQPMVELLYKRERAKSIVSPSGRFFVETQSTLSTPPLSLLRSTKDGAIVATLEEADPSALLAFGYRAPEAFVAKADDGETDIQGVVYWPPDYDPARKYPVIDALYNGFQVCNVPRNFMTGHFTLNPYGGLAIAELGFIVVTLDARGTAMRNKAFHNHSYRNFGDAGLADHVAVLRQLAERHQSFDLDRVGVFGYSFGGYYSTRAILKYPEFFKVAVSGAGCHNWQGLYPGYENLIGDPVFSNGTKFSPDGYEIPSNYLPLDNASLASRLRGKLMIFIGDLDENVAPAINFQFADALQKAGKEFDLVMLWGETHFGSALAPIVIRKTFDFFVRHLMGAEPPDWNATADIHAGAGHTFDPRFA
jgi:dienelactone hydrolase